MSRNAQIDKRKKHKQQNGNRNPQPLAGRCLHNPEGGLTSIYRKNGKWEQEEYIPEIEITILNLSEDHMGNLWRYFGVNYRVS